MSTVERVVQALGWPPVAAASAALSHGRLRVLAYHDVSDGAAFARQLDLLASQYETVTGPLVADWLDGRADLPARPVWITFDDGDPTVLDVAAPLLADHGMSATAFLCAGLIATSRPPWWHVVELAGDHGLIGLDDPGADPAALTRHLKRVDDDERRRTIDGLLARLDAAGVPTERRQWSAADVASWVAAGHEVGNHSWDHPVLECCAPDEQRRQLRRAHERLTSLLGDPPVSFAWPNGDPADAALDEARRLGYRIVLLAEHRVCARRPDAFAMSRLRLDADAELTRARAIVAGGHSAVFQVVRRARAARDQLRRQ